MVLKEYVVLDLETTGLSRFRHRITEIGAVKVREGEVVGQFQTLVNPETPIPYFITKLTGITDEMVKDKPTIKEVFPRLQEFLGNSIIVAHNASFDHGFLEHNARRYGFIFNNRKICTKKLANRLLPSLPSKRLCALCEHFEIVNEQQHRALADVHATKELFQRFSSIMAERGIKEEIELINFEKRSVS